VTDFDSFSLMNTPRFSEMVIVNERAYFFLSQDDYRNKISSNGFELNFERNVKGVEQSTTR